MTNDEKTSSRGGGRFKIFLTGTVVGIFIFAISQTVIGNLLSDWLKQTFIPKGPQIRLRYFVLDIHEAPPLQPAVLQKLFKGSAVYVQENAVTNSLRRFYSSSAISAGEPAGVIRYADVQQYIANAVKERATDLSREEVGRSQRGPIYDYHRRASCARLLRDGLLEEGLAREIASANPAREDVFYTVFRDLRDGCGFYEGPPPYFEESAYLSSLKFLSLDIENIGGAAIGPLELGVSSYGAQGHPLALSPFLQVETSSQDRQDVWRTPFDVFLPGEHLLIPLAILLEPVTSGSYVDLREKLVWEKSWGIAEQQKTTRWYEATSLPSHRFLRLGPGYEVTYIDGAGERANVRRFSGSTLIYAAVDGAGVGSCPLLTAYRPDTGDVVEAERVLVGAIGVAKKRREVHRIAKPASAVKLLEDEPEISHIDFFELRGRVHGGEILTCVALDSRLKKEDGQYVTLRQGESIHIACEQQLGPLEAVISGYYETLDSSVPSGGSVR